MNQYPGSEALALSTSTSIWGQPSEVLTFKENECIFRKGETPKGLYLIKAGCAKVVIERTQLRGRTSSPAYVSKIAGPEEMLGLREIVKNLPHDSSAKTLRPTEVHVFPREAIQNILNSAPSLMKVMLTQLVKEVEHHENSAQFHYLASVQERIWHQLNLLADRFGVTKEDGVHLNLRLTRSELAQLAGTINESLSRHLTELKGQGIIDLQGKEIILKRR